MQAQIYLALLKTADQRCSYMEKNVDINILITGADFYGAMVENAPGE